MKKIQKIACFLLLFVLIASQVSPTVLAASFSSALIRPGTHSIAASPLPVLISVKTANVGIEDSFRISIPAGYQYSGTAGNYTVSTAVLPDGYVAWPGIDTASSVSGNQVTFPSSDLQAGVIYGFYITGGITSNPATVSTVESVWQVETLSSNSQLDTSNVTVPVIASSMVNVSATVPPASSYFHVDMSSSSTGVLSQLQTTTYTLEYRTDNVTDTAITVEATWSQGTIEGSVTPSIDIAEYVAGSASNAFGGAEPVIDPVARTITWTITAISAADGAQTVTFSLSTTQNFKGSETVTFDVTGAVTDPAVSLPSTVTETYKYDAPPSSGGSGTDTSSPSDSTSTTASPTPSPSSTAVSESAEVVSVKIPTISDTTFEVEVTLSNPGTIEILYGTDPDNLPERLTSLDLVDFHTLKLTQLKPDTTYYFRLRTTSRTGVVSLSDSYTSTTASQPLTGIDLAIATLSFQGFPLSSGEGLNTLQSLILPENQMYQLIVRFPTKVSLKSFRVSVIYDQIESVGSAYQIPFVNIGNNTYVAAIQALAPYGRYKVIYEVEDYVGNKQTLLAGTVKVVKPMRVVDAQAKEPVENALITVERYNTQLQLFEKLDLQLFNNSKEWRSNYEGTVQIALPQGKYRFTITAPSYQEKVFDFEITEQTAAYPQVELERIESLFGRLQYFSHTLDQVIQDINPSIHAILSSRSIYTIVSFLSMCLLSLGLLVSLSAKTHISLSRLPFYLLTRIKGFSSRGQKNANLQGRVVNGDNKNPVSRADIAILDDKKTIVATTQTASNGYFHIVLPASPSRILVTEQGFLPNTFVLPKNPATSTLLFKLANQSALSRAETTLSAVFKFISSSLFEFMLIGFFIAQFYFASNFGLLSVLPFVIISLVNLIIWTLYLSTQMMPQQFTELEAVAQK